MKSKNNKTENLLLAIISGILTNTISSFIQGNIESIANRIFLSIGIFFLIWLFLSIVLPEISIIIKRKIYFRLDKLYSNKRIVNTFYDSKTNYLKLIKEYNQLFASKNTFSINNSIFSSDIIICVNELYTVFCGKNKTQRKTVQSVFRDGSVIKDIKNNISRYDYNNLINSIISFVQCIYSDDQENRDYKQLKEMLTELQTVTNNKQSE